MTLVGKKKQSVHQQGNLPVSPTFVRYHRLKDTAGDSAKVRIPFRATDPLHTQIKQICNNLSATVNYDIE